MIKRDLALRDVENEIEALRCFPVMAQLRPRTSCAKSSFSSAGAGRQRMVTAS
jgi:hypothetical protein